MKDGVAVHIVVAEPLVLVGVHGNRRHETVHLSPGGGVVSLANPLEMLRCGGHDNSDLSEEIRASASAAVHVCVSDSCVLLSVGERRAGPQNVLQRRPIVPTLAHTTSLWRRCRSAPTERAAIA